MGVKVEKNATKPPRKPKCPDHLIEMRFTPVRNRWDCNVTGCNRSAFPPNDEDNLNPVLGKGDLELLHISDPDGSKEGRYLLRAMTNNVMLDITDYVAEGGVVHQPNQFPKVVVVAGFTHYIERKVTT